MFPGLRCEWAKSNARATRWAEEVQLLVEEMRHVITFDWKAKWWKEQGNAHVDLSADLADGLFAYAAKQEHVYSSLAMSFGARWHPILLANELSVEWPRIYIPITSVVVHDADSDVDYN